MKGWKRGRAWGWGRGRRSLRRTLLAGLGVGLLLALALASALSYGSAREQADEVFDYQLRQLAVALPSAAFSPLAPGRPDLLDLEEDIVIRIWDSAGELLYDSHGPSVLPPRTRLGFSDVTTREGSWRTYGAQLGDTVVQLAQPMAARQRLAARLALRAVAPMLAMLPLAALLIWVAVGRALAPLQALVTEVSSRDADALQPLVLEDLPREIMPLAAALNALLARLAEALQAQQAFVADAAHELRTPLTALALQAQLAQRANDEPQRRQAFEDLRAGLARASRLVQQLLTLAREENPQARVFSGTVDLVDVARQTVEALEPVAARSQARLELGLGSEPVWVRGDADALSILLKNLLENALLHGSPAAGAIEVNVAAGKPGQGPLLVVRDHGEGISSQEQPRVFDRFYRSPGTQGSGSGLGLAIVAHIAKRHHAQVSLEHAKPGLRCVIHFPDPAAQPQG